MKEKEWLQTSQQILAEVKQWRGTHKKAIFVEIEEEVHRRMVTPNSVLKVQPVQR